MTENYVHISTSVYDEPEYRTKDELNIAIYIMANRDMAGVCPVRLRTVAAACRTSTGVVRRVIMYFESIGKVIIGGKTGKDFTHVWLKSGIYHSLYKGHCSESQLKNVAELVKKWNLSGVFEISDGTKIQNFESAVLQLYATKYKMSIPLVLDDTPKNPPPPSLTDTLTDTLTVTETPSIQKQTGQKISDISLLLKSMNLMLRLSPKLEMTWGGRDLRKMMTDWTADAGEGSRWVMFKMGCFWEQFFLKATNGSDPLGDIENPMGYLYTMIFPDREKGQVAERESPSGVSFREEKTVEYWGKVFFEKDAG